VHADTRISQACLLAAILTLGGVNHSHADETSTAEVIVLATLHQLHAQTDGYSFDDLSAVIERLNPDVLAVELTTKDLESRRDQPNKQEYQKSVFPLLDRHDYKLVPLEPTQPLYDELVGLFRKAGRDLNEQNPAGAESFNTYMSSLFEFLAERWVSPAAVNSHETDILFESKHRFQSALFGPDEAKAWEEWNQHFLRQIMKAAEENPDKRILVLVGAEHAYWLRANLKKSAANLLNTEGLLSEVE